MQNIVKTLAAAGLILSLALSGTATARGGFGGFHGGGFHGGFHGFRGGFYPGYAYGGWWGYPYYPYDYDYYPAGYGYYPPDGPPDYPPGVVYGPGAPQPPYRAARGLSHYCATPRRICVVGRASPVNAPCSCRVAGGFSQGRIAPQ